jgi:hypothetical protein
MVLRKGGEGDTLAGPSAGKILVECDSRNRGGSSYTFHRIGLQLQQTVTQITKSRRLNECAW